MTTKQIAGKTFELNLNVLSVKRLRENDPPIILTETDSLAAFMDDETAQYELCWLLLSSQATTQMIGDAEAFAVFFTDNYKEFLDLIIKELESFFLKTRRTDLASIIRKIYDASMQMLSRTEAVQSSSSMDTAMSLVVEKQIATMETGLDKYIEKTTKEIAEIRKTVTSSSGNLPESSGSTPAPSPTAS